MKRIVPLIAFIAASFAAPAFAQTSTMCDPAYENCRVQIVAAMDAEKVGIDMFVWFGEDQRYTAALDRAKRRGVRVRVIANDRWSTGSHRTAWIDALRKYNIPTRVTRSMPAHIKGMVFAGQGRAMLTGANFSSDALRPEVPFVAYTDEVVMFSHDVAFVESMKQLFEKLWVNDSLLRNYSGTISLKRHYAQPVGFVFDPRLWTGMGSMTETNKKTAALIDAETIGVDVIMYRMTDHQTRDALIRALRRGVPVRILTDLDQVEDYAGMRAWLVAVITEGAQVRYRTHQGMTHEKFALFHGQLKTLIPTNNWDTWEALSATFVADDPLVYDWGRTHFEWKWRDPWQFR